MHEQEFLHHLTISLAPESDWSGLAEQIADLEDKAQRLSELRLIAAIAYGTVREAWGMTASDCGFPPPADPDMRRTLAYWIETSAEVEKVQSEVRHGFWLALNSFKEVARDS